MRSEETSDLQKNSLQVMRAEDALNNSSEIKETPQTHQQRARAHWDRLWLTDPEKAMAGPHPVHGELEKQRVDSICSLLQQYGPYLDKRVVDLGSGSGKIALYLQRAGAKVDAIDLSNLALRHLEKQQEKEFHPIRTMRAYVPYTELEDGVYDCVICSGLVGELPAQEQRVLIAEMYRLVHPQGHILLATSIDTTTDGALDKWHRLIETELQIIDEKRLYHAYFLALLRMGRKLPKSLQWMVDKLEKTGWGASWLAARCLTFRGERGVSHVATLAKRKPLQHSGEAKDTPLSTREQRLRRRIWE